MLRWRNKVTGPRLKDAQGKLHGHRQPPSHISRGQNENARQTRREAPDPDLDPDPFPRKLSEELWWLRFKLKGKGAERGWGSGTYLEYFAKIKIYEQIKKR